MLFDTLDAGTRTEVIDTRTGRPVAILDSRSVARRECDILNNAAANGPKDLAIALGAVDDTEDASAW
jgi:hypothetical protein